MIYTVRNEHISVNIDSIGAEIKSIFANETEYLLKGGKGERSVNAFPFCGNSFRSKYLYEGEFYPSENDGFIKRCAFTLSEQTKERLILNFSSTSETKKIYPFDFDIIITYTLEDTVLHVSYRLSNKTEKKMLFSLGTKLVLACGDGFADAKMSFSSPVSTESVFLNEEGFVTEKAENPALSSGTELKMSDTESCLIFAKHRNVKIKPDALRKEFTINCGEIPYIGVKSVSTEYGNAFVISLFTSLPSKDGSVDNIREKRGVYQIAPGETFDLNYCLEFK